MAERYRRQVADSGDGWFLPASAAFLEQWGIEDAAGCARSLWRTHQLTCGHDMMPAAPDATAELFERTALGH